MSRRQITPCEFAQLLQVAQDNRSIGNHSKIAAVRHACHSLGISDDWSAPALAFLNDSPTIAEEWGKRMFNEALDRAAARAGAS